MTPMDPEDFDSEAVRIALALAHMNWIQQSSDAAANLSHLSPGQTARYEEWERNSAPMDWAADAASYWVGRRAVSILINEFVFSLPDAIEAIATYSLSHPRALATAMHKLDVTPSLGVMRLIAEIAQRQANEQPTDASMILRERGTMQ